DRIGLLGVRVVSFEVEEMGRTRRRDDEDEEEGGGRNGVLVEEGTTATTGEEGFATTGEEVTTTPGSWMTFGIRVGEGTLDGGDFFARGFGPVLGFERGVWHCRRFGRVIVLFLLPTRLFLFLFTIHTTGIISSTIVVIWRWHIVETTFVDDINIKPVASRVSSRVLVHDGDEFFDKEASDDLWWVICENFADGGVVSSFDEHVECTFFDLIRSAVGIFSTESVS